MRLLIGIGRFKEMSYIIGLLMQHDEFESLLSDKGTEKVLESDSVGIQWNPSVI